MEAILQIDNIIKDIEIKFSHQLEITSSIRTPNSQAKAMYPHFESNSDTLRSYASYKKPWLDEIEVAYKLGKTKGELKDSIIERMSKVIEKQVSENKLISNHLTNSARDIRTKKLSSKEINQLILLLRQRMDLVVLDETRTVSPHIHIHLK